MAATTAIDLIKRSLQEIRVLAYGEPVPGDRSADALVRLNAFLESLSIEGLMIIADTEENFSLTTGTADYTWGTGGDIATARPLQIRDDAFIRSGSTDYPVLYKTLNVYRKTWRKNTSARPRIFTYNPEYPLGKLYFFPTPSSTHDFHVRTMKQLSSFALLTTSVNLAPGYEWFFP